MTINPDDNIPEENHKEHDLFFRIESGLDKVLPGIENAEKGVMVYRQYYPEELEKQFGVLAIHISI